jgi:hypothetical protein
MISNASFFVIASSAFVPAAAPAKDVHDQFEHSALLFCTLFF